MGARAQFSGWIAREWHNPFRHPHVRIRLLGFRLMAGGWPDGQRFLMIKASEQESAATQLNVVLNWSDELRRLAPAGKP